LFYSFYSRIEEAIRSKWEHEVEISINNLDKGRYNSPKNIWSTRLDILLTKEGKYYKAILLKESGIVGLDMAAINAFREANFFPHPPKEMINEEGYIRLQYQFHVYYDPNSPTQQRINL
jgi:protein TonB